MAGFDVSGVEPSVSATTALVNSQLCSFIAADRIQVHLLTQIDRNSTYVTRLSLKLSSLTENSKSKI
jgi:hypothetical protein